MAAISFREKSRRLTQIRRRLENSTVSVFAERGDEVERWPRAMPVHVGFTVPP